MVTKPEGFFEAALNAGGDQSDVDLEPYPALGGESGRDAGDGTPHHAAQGTTFAQHLHRRPLSREQVRYLAIVLQLESANERE